MSARPRRILLLAALLVAGAVAVVGWRLAIRTPQELPAVAAGGPDPTPAQAPLPEPPEAESQPQAATAVPAVPASPTSVDGTEELSEVETAGADTLPPDATEFGPTAVGSDYGYGQSPAAEPDTPSTTVAPDRAGAEQAPAVPLGSHPTAVPAGGYVDESMDTPELGPETSPTGAAEWPAAPGR